jgi:rhomboid protease GluP
MTASILLATLVAFGLEIRLGGSMDPEVLLRMGAVRGDRLVAHGELFRLVMPLLLHFGPVHLVLNLLAFVQLGVLVESLWGSGRLLLFYVVSGVMASLASAALAVPGYNVEGSVGASGAILGLAGLVLGASWYGTEPTRTWLRKLLGARLLAFVLITFAIGAVLPIIDNSAHLGGFLAGMLLAAAHPDPNERQDLVAVGGGSLAGIAVVASVVGATLQGERAVETFALDAGRASVVQLSNHDFDAGPDYQWAKAPAAIELVEMLRWFVKAGRTDEGLDVFERTLDRIRDPVTLQLVVGLLELDRPPVPAAFTAAAERWVEVAPDDAEALNALAWTLVTVSDPALRDPVRAEDLSHESLTRIADPDSASGRRSRAMMLDTRAEALYQLGRFEEARRVQHEAVDLAVASELEADTLAELKGRLTKIEAAGRG